MAGKKYPKISAHLTGRSVSDETRRKISEAVKGRSVPANRAPARDGDKRQAHMRVKHLVKTGQLPHPSTLPCTDCGQEWEPGLSRHEYDHHLGYDGEHHESVEPVCSKCHHAREKSRGRVRKPQQQVA